jgi:hypothetical protein
MLWFLLISSLLIFSFCLKACLALSLLSSFLMQNFTIQDSNCVSYDNLVTQEMILRYAPRWYGMYAMGSMITNVHKWRCRQYSKASLDRQDTQNWAMVVINVMARSRPRCHRDYRPCLRLMVSKWWSGCGRWRVRGEDERRWCWCWTVPKLPKRVRKRKLQPRFSKQNWAK